MNWLVQIAIIVVSYVISRALAPKPPLPKAAALEDFNFPKIDEGTPEIVIFGDVWVESWQVLGVGNLRTTPIKSKSGGKK